MSLLPVLLCLPLMAEYQPPEPASEQAPPAAEQLQLLKTFRSEFIDIRPGQDKFPRSFVMGDDQGSPAQRPAREVTFQYDFAVGKYEVPQNLWAAVMGRNPSRWKGPRNSVEMLSFDEAQEFCRRATRLMRAAKLIDDRQVIRLPSEAEWEYAARAGTDSKWSFGDDQQQLGRHAWYDGNAAGNDPAVGELRPNPWGLYDMHGYLWEWCLDSGHDDYRGSPRDGSAWQPGDPQRRVIRGGSWKDPADSLASRCRSGQFRHQTAAGERTVVRFRGGIDKNIRDDAVGLRCVLAPEAAREP